MKISTFALGAAMTLLAQAASAAVIGSLDQSRAYSFVTNDGTVREGALSGNQYSNLRGHLASTGSTIIEGATSLSSDYLAGVDLFITGTPTLDSNPVGQASAAEQQALSDWVFDGGVAVILGETGNAFAQTANTWLGAFGLEISGNYGGGTGRWSNSENPLLDGVNDGALNIISLSAGGGFAADGAYDDVLARYGTSATNGVAAVVGLQWGAGYVIASGDATPFTNDRFNAFNLDGVTPSDTAVFVSNVVERADASIPAPIPVPAALPLLVSGLVALGLLRRRARR